MNRFVRYDTFETNIKTLVMPGNRFPVSAHQYLSENMPTNSSVIGTFPAECFLTLMQLGANGPTENEIWMELGHVPCDELTISTALHGIIVFLTTQHVTKLELVTKIYVSQEYNIKAEFAHLVLDFCRAKLENVDFTQLCANTMDEWMQNNISNSFQTKIADDMLTPTTKMVLVNGVIFRGRWKFPFWKKKSPMQFFVSETESFETESMINKRLLKYYYFKDLRTKILDIELESKEEASLVLIIPDAIQALPLVEENIFLVFGLNRQLFDPTDIELELPIFKIETMVDFKHIFIKSGIRSIFNEDVADLSGISDEKGLYLNNFIQKAVFDLDEKGINADDSFPRSGSSEDLTSPDCDSTSSHLLYIKANRPFAFYVKVQNVILFTGRFVEPSS